MREKWTIGRYTGSERGPYRNRYICVSTVTISTCKEGKKSTIITNNNNKHVSSVY